jgi:hypothetical protein
VVDDHIIRTIVESVTAEVIEDSDGWTVAGGDTGRANPAR